MNQSEQHFSVLYYPITTKNGCTKKLQEKLPLLLLSLFECNWNELKNYRYKFPIRACFYFWFIFPRSAQSPVTSYQWPIRLFALHFTLLLLQKLKTLICTKPLPQCWTLCKWARIVQIFWSANVSAEVSRNFKIYIYELGNPLVATVAAAVSDKTLPIVRNSCLLHLGIIS